MKRIFWNSLVLVALCLLAACRGERWDDDLTLPIQNYSDTQLNIDGYYYFESNGSNQVYFFYRDGVVLDGLVVSLNELTATELDFMNGEYYNFAKNNKTCWGRYIIDGNIIKREFWPPSNGNNLEAWTHEGIILNDTTFKMTKAWRSCKPKEVNEIEQVYHFKRSSPKPDSTNTFTD
jgi:hypothetical protein